MYEALAEALRRDDGAALWSLSHQSFKVAVPPADKVRSEAEDLLDRLGRGERLNDAQQVRLDAYSYAVERPSFFLNDRTFGESLGQWEELKRHRASIERLSQSVGRIESGPPKRQRAIATGFVVAPGMILTNRHVVHQIAARDGKGGWQLDDEAAPRVDFSEQRHVAHRREHAITKVMWVSSDERFDMALLKIARRDQDGTAAPPPLALAQSYRPRKARKVYLVGYPAREPHDTEPEVSDLVFAGQYDVKRLQPGRILKSAYLKFDHDASTLAGNSGSCVVDLPSGVVVGLHYNGVRSFANFAVPLWRRGIKDLLRG